MRNNQTKKIDSNKRIQQWIDANSSTINTLLDHLGEDAESGFRPGTAHPEYDGTIVPVRSKPLVRPKCDQAKFEGPSARVDVLSNPRYLKSDDKIHHRTELRILEQADLTPTQLEVLKLKYEYGLSVTEIARYLGLHHSTVAERLNRAEKKLSYMRPKHGNETDT